MAEQPEIHVEFEAMTLGEKIFSVVDSYKMSIHLMESCLNSAIPSIPLVDRRIKLCKIELESLEREKHSDFYEPSRDESILKGVEDSLKDTLGKLEGKKKEWIARGYLSQHDKKKFEDRLWNSVVSYQRSIGEMQECMNTTPSIERINRKIVKCNQEIEHVKIQKNGNYFEHLVDDPRFKDIERALEETLANLHAKKKEWRSQGYLSRSERLAESNQRLAALLRDDPFQSKRMCPPSLGDVFPTISAEEKVKNRSNIYNNEITQMSKCLSMPATDLRIGEVTRNISSCKRHIATLEREKKSDFYKDLVNDPRVENIGSSLNDLLQKLEAKKTELKLSGQQEVIDFNPILEPMIDPWDVPSSLPSLLSSLPRLPFMGMNHAFNSPFLPGNPFMDDNQE